MTIAERADDSALAALLERIALLEQRVRVLERRDAGCGARDVADRTLVLLVARTLGSAPFSARRLWTLARVDAALGAAIADTCCGSALELGHLFARLEGVDVDGIAVTRGRRGREGVLWRCATTM